MSKSRFPTGVGNTGVSVVLLCSIAGGTSSFTLAVFR